MLSYRKTTIIDIDDADENISWVKVELDKKIEKAVNYNQLTGPVNLGDMVIINTTAVELSLGTGGVHFIIFNYNNQSRSIIGKGHIMKLRYTPQQLRCLAAEEEDSQYHNVFTTFKSLNKHTVIIGSLHSMLAPVVAMIKWKDKSIKINYIMTDGGSLPIFFSDTVRKLKNKGLIDRTITIGHAFGGDLECTNIYTGLIAAKEVLKGDVTIVIMGPGIVGTGTKYGFSGIEQGYIIDAVNTLGGEAVIIPRISFKDSRERHFGISHHTTTVLSEICKTNGRVVLPKLERDKHNILTEQIRRFGLHKKFKIIYEYGNNISEVLDCMGLNISTMGRGCMEDKEYFETLGAVASYVVKMQKKEKCYVNCVEKTMKSDKIYEGKIVNLRVDTVELPDKKYSKREIVEHPGVAAVVPITKDGSIILVEQYRKPIEKLLLEIPAGKIEVNEEPKETALRELAEETGFKANKMEYIFEFYTSPGFSTEKIYLFLATDLEYCSNTRCEDENIEIKKIKIQELRNMVSRGEVYDSKTIIGILFMEKYMDI